MNTPRTTAFPDAWAHVRDLVAWLDASNGTGEHETAMRLLKLTEEAGEVAQAYLGMTGQNPRKGRTHTPDDVAAELCDVILAAMAALHRFTDTPELTFHRTVAARHQRMTALTTLRTA